MNELPGCECEVPAALAPRTGLAIYPGAIDHVPIGGKSVIAIYGGVVGGLIYNPLTTQGQKIKPLDQTEHVTIEPEIGELNTYELNNIPELDGTYSTRLSYDVVVYGPPEPLYVSFAGPASLFENDTTFMLLPGESAPIPPNISSPVWVNAKTSGHTFSAITVQNVTQAPTPYAGTFPPSGPTGKTTTIPSYLYKQYTDDPDLPAFINAYNTLSQEYVDWFNALNLPIYTRLSGALLDWVAEGLYGMYRPTLYSGTFDSFGPLDTYALNEDPPLGAQLNTSVFNDIALTNDDVFKRILTWHKYRADGFNPSIEWFKRRAVRFLFGVDGKDYAGPSSSVSVSVINGAISIIIVSGISRFTSTSALNEFAFNEEALGDSASTVSEMTIPPLAAIFAEAINTGALEMPEQYVSTRRIGIIGDRNV